jgi:hypothetical protein
MFVFFMLSMLVGCGGTGASDLADSSAQPSGDTPPATATDASAGSAVAQPRFAAPVAYAESTPSESVVTADFDGDGKLDLAFSDSSRAKVSVLLGQGDGTFAPPVEYPAGDSNRFVATGDLNSDGKPDLVLVDGDSSSACILLNRGAGIFAAPLKVMVGYNPLTVAIADFNGDGKPDLATNDGSHDIAVLLNDGVGGFAAPVDYETESFPHAVAAGDFNNDNRPDLAYAADESYIGVLLNQGSGFTPSRFVTGYHASGVAVGDFNGDGLVDVAAANDYADNVSVLVNQGKGMFAAPVKYALPAGSHPSSVAKGDFNGDGQPDLVVASTGVFVLPNTGNARFTKPVELAAAGGTVEGIAVGDFNGDGWDDIAAAQSLGVTVLLNLRN